MDKVMSLVKNLASSEPTVDTDDGSVVTNRDININSKCLKMKIETESDDVRKPGNTAAPTNQTDYTAKGGSVICTDKITGTIDEVDLSVSVKKPKVSPAKVDETKVPSSQGTAVAFILEHKLELIDCLRADHSFILQHVHAKHIITDRQYQNIKHIYQPEKAVTELIDTVIGKGEESCSLFLQVLKEPDVFSTYPRLREIKYD
ncbi:uncharacterized protein si:dkey-10c21.1 [Cheilinus undulatus]|uniref:uncharacterized protein si:dkey-10c21.1 n=1 Tax=Cheilinus undulatus TaxID=241271 RepID=UPI001BD6188F|nr:uncharacterized protein si:dkey-10c21.1 [Cheilinus undulatus]